jgi:hypothetical protein
MMRRREFICLLGGAAAAWPLVALAQQRKVPTIGVLVVEASGLEQFWRLFREDMAELGYVEGQNIRYEFRSDQGQISRASALAAELVRLNVDLSLPKTISERIDGVVRQGSDTQQCSRSARSAVYKARPSQAKCASARHYNRSRISQEFVASARR